MYVVSCRRGFDSDRRLASANRYRNYTDPSDSSAFAEVTLTKLLEAAANRHVCVLVHGFNNNMTEVMNAYWEMVTRMSATGVTGPDGYGLVIGFTWPGMATSPGYFAAVATATKSGPRLLDLIHQLRSVAHSVDVQTHSLGARVALTALQDPAQVFIDQLLLSAPAVDHHLLEPGRKFFAATNSCNRCLIFHSKKDPVLGGAYWVGDTTDGIHPALGLKGPRNKSITLSKTANVYVVDCSARVREHSGYRKTNAYFQHWKQTLKGGPLSRYDELG